MHAQERYLTYYVANSFLPWSNESGRPMALSQLLAYLTSFLFACLNPFTFQCSREIECVPPTRLFKSLVLLCFLFCNLFTSSFRKSFILLTQNPVSLGPIDSLWQYLVLLSYKALLLGGEVGWGSSSNACYHRNLKNPTSCLNDWLIFPDY